MTQGADIPDRETPLIRAHGLSIGYGGRAIAAGIDMGITPGQSWGVIGPNGAGKTTLIRTLMGVMPPVDGAVHRRAGIRFGYVKQRDTLHDLYPFTVEEVVRTGRYRGVAPFRRRHADDTAQVEQALERTGIADLKHRPVQELSGGQKQRVLIARALCAEPDVIILDEPTNDMDIAGEESVLALIRDVRQQTGAAVLIISHLIHAVLRVADQIVFIHDRGIGVFPKSEFVANNHLERFYGIPIHIHEYPDGSYAVAAARPLQDKGEGDP